MSGTITDHSDLDELSEVHDAFREARQQARREADHEEAKRSFWRELPVLLVVALLAAVGIKTFLVQAFFIPSASMEDTLVVDDRVLVNKLAHDVDDLNRGDIIVFDNPYGADDRNDSLFGAVIRGIAESVGLSAPQSDFIKRVIAFPGETIEVRDGRVYVDGLPLAEPYVAAGSTPGRDHERETVPDRHVFVMGDNRGLSEDSRVFGPVPESDIVGRAFVIVWPPSRWSGL